MTPLHAGWMSSARVLTAQGNGHIVGKPPNERTTDMTYYWLGGYLAF